MDPETVEKGQLHVPSHLPGPPVGAGQVTPRWVSLPYIA